MKVDVSLDLYRIFCAVVRTGNMSAAARELFISQPAVSMSIVQLEDRMGSPLLVRTAKGVYPTAEGKLLIYLSGGRRWDWIQAAGGKILSDGTHGDGGAQDWRE